MSASTVDTVPEQRAEGRPPAVVAVIAVPLGLAAVVAVILLAFGLPAVEAEPRGVPIGMAGPAPAAEQVTAALAEREPEALDVRTFSDEADLSAAIRDREVYGGLVVGADGMTVLTASAASPAVAQLLGQLGSGLAAQQGAPAQVRDVVPLPDDDPRGAGLAAGMLPLVLGSILPAVAIGALARGGRMQITAATTYAVVAGLALAAVLHYVFGSLTGSYLAESAVLAAAVLAATLALLGLHRLAGRPGLALGALTLLLLGNPLSGVATAPEFLASPWQQIGQAMPPGAGSQLLRSVSFFDGAGPLTPWYVLAAWGLAGLLLLAWPARRPTTA